jgi:NADH dehydrogenase FAD-containing subunit
MAPHEILILGGNLGGVQAAHYLLRKTIPELRKHDPAKTYHITIVTPNTHLFWKIASPRALLNPTLTPEDKILRPLSSGFAKYSAEECTLLTHAYATKLDAENQRVTIEIGYPEFFIKELSYDSLILATGTTSTSPLWTFHRDENLTSAALRKLHEILPKAKTVLIAGAGPVGVETAGQIASAFPSAQITLLSGAHRVLPQTLPATSARAQSYLESISKVEVINNVRVTGTDTKELGPTRVMLDNGEVKSVDLYIDATGGTPNSGYLPTSWLDESGRVITGDSYFRVRGPSTSAETKIKNIYVIGDLVAGSSNTSLDLDAMIPVLGSSFAIDILGFSAPAPGYIAWLYGLIFGNNGEGKPVQREFRSMKGTMIIPIGFQGGVGQVFGWRAPSWLVKMGKGNTFLVEVVEGILTGEKYKV